MALALTSTKLAFVSPALALGTEYRVYVDEPRGIADRPLPAVVVLDGDHFFDTAVATARTLEQAGSIEPVRIAGIGYGKRFGDPGNRRGRDFTPTASPEEPSSGGAAAFLEHLETHLWPELARRYPTERDASVLAGHSLSALFVLYAFFQARPVLYRAMAGAPSIWWDGRSVLTHIARFRDAHAAHSAELFLGVGEEETPSMTGDLALFEQQLRDRPFAGLRWQTQHFPGHDHYTVLPELFRAGLQALFPRSRP